MTLPFQAQAIQHGAEVGRPDSRGVDAVTLAQIDQVQPLTLAVSSVDEQGQVRGARR